MEPNYLEKVTNYTLPTSRTKEELEDAVSHLETEGWEVYGEPYQSRFYHHQPMIMKEQRMYNYTELLYAPEFHTKNFEQESQESNFVLIVDRLISGKQT